MNMKIKIYTTGGTIDKVYFDQKSDCQVGDPQAKGVLERANVVLDYEVESIVRKDSLDFTDEDRELIGMLCSAYCSADSERSIFGYLL